MFCYNCNSINFDNDYDGEEKLGKRKKMAGSPGDDDLCDGHDIGDDDDGIDDHGDNNDTWDIGDDEKFGSSSPGTLD